jgi:hypothetical protein
MQIKTETLVKEKKLLSNNTHYYNTNFFLSDALALFILG